MEFDKSRVFTALNADELKRGDKVFVADQLSVLKQRVQEGKKNSAIVLQKINGEDWGRRFGLTMSDFALAYLVERAENCTNCDTTCMACIKPDKTFRCEDYSPKTEQKAEKHTNYNHCEEAKKAYVCAMTNACPEKHYRPFKDTYELIKVWDAKYRYAYGLERINNGLDMPLIWVREKGCEKSADLITCYGSKGITVRGEGMYFDTLFTMFEFLDGTPCGVEE